MQTFKNWGKENIFGVKTEEKDGRKLVNFIWCKICAAHKDALLTNPSLKGSVKKSMKAFTDGTSSVTKFQV